MVIKYQDNNLIVSYLQIFLREYFSYTVRKVIPRKKSEPFYYEIVNTEPLKITGYYNAQTYSSLALYMAYNYPKEGYPVKWTSVDNISWKSEDFFYDGSNDEELLKVISDNMENLTINRSVIEVPERVLSYVFGEVVSPSSTPEEILRVKTMIYPTPLGVKSSLDYDSQLTTKVEEIQKNWKLKYQDKNGNIVVPQGVSGEAYKDTISKFKVTGYVDPWTEVAIKGGVETDD